MGAALSCIALPALGGIGSILASCFSAAACSLACRSCNCNNSIATRVGYAFAWILLSDWASKQLESITHGYLRLNCKDNSCYGAFGVQRVGFALALFHIILSLLLIGVHDSRSKRAAIQNGWWGPKVVIWILLVVMSFFIPTGFFVFWGNYVALIGAGIFILFGLILLVDFAHTWSESCMEKWEMSDTNKWKFILVGSTMLMYLGAIILTGIMYGYFAGSGCTKNIFWITFNLVLAIGVTLIAVLPAVQDANPRSGLAQSSMVVIYCAYLILSAVANEPDEGTDCNPLRKARGTRTTTVLMGAIFTFLAVAYSTSRAATQGGKAGINQNEYQPVPMVTSQPSGTSMRRSDALLAAVESGALPVSALDEADDDDDDEGDFDAKDDEKNGVQYNYSFFHVVFALAAMYISMVLTNWNTFSEVEAGSDNLILIGQSWPAVWVKVVSSWICYGLYGFSLLAPVLFPDRFSDY
ncbi:hypothetical protein DFQ27_009755 [Actinomortierella ambigua]|uniref:TMS membrane protein/tumor differentially expressed protein n=1 Tax=Actinomortierella ambigua TaxID=1343610 RepID=A0A9P6UAE8_9FUNG|nr:hypothetical protein DFQ26_003140 [Actinomortierella ambigua]KAG0266453.1 hypothetical protein DFQ27_009755 [Actinomortierella ambigua]